MRHRGLLERRSLKAITLGNVSERSSKTLEKLNLDSPQVTSRIPLSRIALASLKASNCY